MKHSLILMVFLSLNWNMDSAIQEPKPLEDYPSTFEMDRMILEFPDEEECRDYETSIDIKEQHDCCERKEE